MDRQTTIPDRSQLPGGIRGIPGIRMRLLTTFLCLILALSSTSCAYYNTFYHAKRYYKQAEKTQREFAANPGAKDTRSAALYKQSIEKCQKVIDNYPGSKWQDDAHLLMAKSYYGRGDYLNAKKTLKKFDDQLADSELYPEAKFWRGKTAYAQAEYPEARQVWEELLSEHPDFDDREEVEYYLAESEWQDGHNEKAEEAFEAYLAAYPGGKHAADTRIELGRVYLDNKEYDAAASEFEEVAERGKEEADRNEARMLLGETMELQGRNEEALKIYNELAEDLDPAVYKWRMSEEELAVLRETERAAAAEEAAEQAAEAAYQDSLRRAQGAAPDSLQNPQGGNNNFGQVTQTSQMSQQQRAEAQRQAQQNLQRRRDMADPIDQQIGQILLREGGVIAKLGRPFEAIDVYKQVVVEFPRTPYASEAQYRIGYTYEVLLEEFDEAKNAYVEVNQHGVSSFREDAARRAKNLGTVAALLAQSQTDSLSAATSAAAEAMFMRAELYLFQQESPEKALAEYASIEQEFPESEHAAKAGLAIAWVTSFTLGDTAAAMEKYALTAAAYPNTEYGRRASAMVYGPEKDPEPEEFAGPSVDELRAEENLAAIALMYEAEADSTDDVPQDAPAGDQPAPGIAAAGGVAVARVGAGNSSEPVPGDGSLSSAVRSTSDLVAVPDTAAADPAGTNPPVPDPVGEPTASTGDETEDRGGASAAGVAAAGAAVVGGGIAAGGSGASQEPMRMNDPNPTMAPVEAETTPVEAEDLAGDDGGDGVSPIAAGAAVGVAAGAAAGGAATTTDIPVGASPTSDPLSSESSGTGDLNPLEPLAGDTPVDAPGPAAGAAAAAAVGTAAGDASGAAAMTPDTPVGTPPTSDPLSSGSPVAGDLNPLVPVGGAAAGTNQSAQDEMVPGALMDVPRGLYLDPLAVPKDGPSPVKSKNTSAAANKTSPPTSSKATTPSKPATEKKEPEKKEPEKKEPQKKEAEKAKQPEKKEPEKAPAKPNPGANP